MINLNLNLDPKQPVQFSSVESLRKAVVMNESKYDGLCLFCEEGDEFSMVELVYVEVYDNWEVATNEGKDSESFATVEGAVDAFIVELKELGVGW